MIETGQTDTIEYIVQTSKGNRWFQARISGIENGDNDLVVTARDITERKEIEASLISAKEEAEKANRAKSQLLSLVMAHHLVQL